MTLRPPLALLLATAAFAASAANHDRVVEPVATAGPWPVACTNVEQDPALIAQYGGTPPQDFWEGKPANGQLRYMTQILRNPGTTQQLRVAVPADSRLYPQFNGQLVDHVAITCFPTTSTNTDPGYALPQTGTVVPRMQPAGTAPKVLGTRMPLILFSHGLSGSPISPGHLEALVALASQGYVVAAVFHGDVRFSRVRLEDLGDLAFLLTRFDEFAEMELMRPLSLKALADFVLADPVLSAAVDPDRIGAFGASLGGQAVLNLAGAKLTTSVGLSCRETARDPRVKAVVGYVPYAGQTFLPAFCDDQSGMDSVRVPFLGMGGTRDTTAPIGLTRQAVNRIPGTRYLVEMDIPHEFRAEYAGELLTWSSTFFNAYLHVASDPTAMARLIKMQSIAGGPADALTIDVHVPFAATFGDAPVIEFHNPTLNHFFMTINPGEMAGNAGWLATGHAFKGWRLPPAEPAFAAAPVCRFYGGYLGGPNSHFYTAEPDECTGLARPETRWTLESIGFHIKRVTREATALTCPSGYLAVNRAYNNGFPRNDTNHRYTTSDSTWREMGRMGWALEGTVMCSLP